MYNTLRGKERSSYNLLACLYGPNLPLSGDRPHQFHSPELSSKDSGIQNNPHLVPHEHDTRDFTEPREDDLIQIDGKAVANAIREWVREHQTVDKSSA